MAKRTEGKRRNPRRHVGVGAHGVLYSEAIRDRSAVYGPTPTRETVRGKTMKELQSRGIWISDLVWRYLAGGKRKHALIPGYALGEDSATWQPVCGIYILRPDQWLGVGSREEKLQLAQMPQCQACSDEHRAETHVNKF